MQSHQPKIGILALTDYASNLKNAGYQQLHRKVFRFEEIFWITTDNVKTNYVLIEAENSRQGLLNMSMRSILKELPQYFVRISNSHIVNIMHKNFRGLINNTYLDINGEKLKVSSNYRGKLNEALKTFYVYNSKDAGNNGSDHVQNDE